MAGGTSRAAINAGFSPPASAATWALSAPWPEARILITTNRIVVATATPSRSHLALIRPGVVLWSVADAATALSDCADDANLFMRRRWAGRGANRGGLMLGAP